jgi:FkbM family methyltransferase
MMFMLQNFKGLIAVLLYCTLITFAIISSNVAQKELEASVQRRMAEMQQDQLAANTLVTSLMENLKGEYNSLKKQLTNMPGEITSALHNSNWGCSNTKDTAPQNGVPIKFPYGLNGYYAKGTKHYDWWDRSLQGTTYLWEPETFDYFHRFIKENTTYVGFGEWIGPTILFAAYLNPKQLFGLEPDPIAFDDLIKNVAVNPQVKHKITVERVCISNTTGTFTFTGNGGSGSVINGIGQNGVNTFDVECFPLLDYLRMKGALTTDVFIKVDTEGAEVLVIPSCYDWLKVLNPKPTLFISMHNTLSSQSKEVQRKFKEVLQLYKYYGEAAPGREGGKPFTKEDLCQWCDIIATDFVERLPSEIQSLTKSNTTIPVANKA